MDEVSDTGTVETVARLISILGGPAAAAEAFGETINNVQQWLHRKYIPPSKYKRHKAILAARGIPASEDLWKFDPLLGESSGSRAVA